MQPMKATYQKHRKKLVTWSPCLFILIGLGLYLTPKSTPKQRPPIPTRTVQTALATYGNFRPQVQLYGRYPSESVPPLNANNPPRVQTIHVKVGDAVQAFSGAAGPYPATVREVEQDGAFYVVDWADKDPNKRRQPMNFTAEV